MLDPDSVTGSLSFHRHEPSSLLPSTPDLCPPARPPAAGAMLPWLPRASAPLAQTLRNTNVVMNQHLCREPSR